MRRHVVRAAAGLARRVLLPPALVGAAVIWLMLVLTAATESDSSDRGPFGASDPNTREIAVEFSDEHLEGAPSGADIRRARIPLSERKRRLHAHPYYELYATARRRYHVSWYLVASIHYQETGYRRAGSGGTRSHSRGHKARVRQHDFRKVMAIASRLHAAGVRRLGPRARRATARRYGSGARGRVSAAMVIERARAWQLLGVIPLPGSGELATPVRGSVGGCGYFGCPRPGHLHNGIDFLAPAGRPVHAADAGRVALVQPPGASGGYGNFICLQHRPHLASCYAHLGAFAPGLRRGKRVKRGQVIGLVGSTGSSSGPHLHFELRRGAARCQSCAVDPLPLLDGQVPQAAVPELLRHPRSAPAPAPVRNAGYVPPPVAPPVAPPAAPPATRPTRPTRPARPAPTLTGPPPPADTGGHAPLPDYSSPPSPPPPQPPSSSGGEPPDG